MFERMRKCQVWLPHAMTLPGKPCARSTATDLYK